MYFFLPPRADATPISPEEFAKTVKARSEASGRASECGASGSVGEERGRCARYEAREVSGGAKAAGGAAAVQPSLLRSPAPDQRETVSGDGTLSVQTEEEQLPGEDCPRRCGIAVRTHQGVAGRCSDVRAYRTPETVSLTQLQRWFQVKRVAELCRWLEGQGRPSRSNASKTSH